MTQTVAAWPPSGDRVTRRQWLTLLVLSLGLAIVIIDGTIVNVAIPSIQREFNAAFKNLEWVNSVYSLVFAALIITWGRVGDQVGRKRIFIAGVAVFVLGSVLAGAARGIGTLIAARTVQGLGAAMTSPSTCRSCRAPSRAGRGGSCRGVGRGGGRIGRAGAAAGRLADNQRDLALGVLRQHPDRADRRARRHFRDSGVPRRLGEAQL